MIRAGKTFGLGPGAGSFLHPEGSEVAEPPVRRWCSEYSDYIPDRLEVARLKSFNRFEPTQPPFPGGGRHFEISDEDIARLVLTSDSFDDVASTYTGCGHHLLSYYEVEQGLCLMLATASHAQDVLAIVQFWLIAAERLGYGELYRPVLESYDRFVSFLDFQTGCIPQCDLLNSYQILATRHRFLEDRRFELTMAVLTASVVGGGEQKCDTMFCGFHPSFMCTDDLTFDRDWGVHSGRVFDEMSPEMRAVHSPVFCRDLHAEAQSRTVYQQGRYLEPAVSVEGLAPHRKRPSGITWSSDKGLRISASQAREYVPNPMCYVCTRAHGDEIPIML